VIQNGATTLGVDVDVCLTGVFWVETRLELLGVALIRGWIGRSLMLLILGMLLCCT
jgi:hypothetical protein